MRAETPSGASAGDRRPALMMAGEKGKGMNIKTARELLREPIQNMTLEQLQRHRVRLLDARRESEAAYGFAQAVRDGFYKIVESDSASGYFPADAWLTHNLTWKLDRVGEAEDRLFYGDYMTPDEFADSIKTYRFVYCKTLNALGETCEVDYDNLHDLILCLINFRNKDCEKMCAGYSVYELTEDGALGETLLNWQRDGKNIFGRLVDPALPGYFFTA